MVEFIHTRTHTRLVWHYLFEIVIQQLYKLCFILLSKRSVLFSLSQLLLQTIIVNVEGSPFGVDCILQLRAKFHCGVREYVFKEKKCEWWEKEMKRKRKRKNKFLWEEGSSNGVVEMKQSMASREGIRAIGSLIARAVVFASEEAHRQHHSRRLAMCFCCMSTSALFVFCYCFVYL